MKLVLIRAGNFRMGSSEPENDATADEKPQHRVRITKLFYLGKYEVTRGEFRKFVAATKYKTDAERKIADGPDGLTWLNPGFIQTDEHPVVGVTWNDAIEFCKWLGKQHKMKYRLPTEAEWEWACRAGSIERWNCGDRIDDLKGNVNIADTALKATDPEIDWGVKWDDGFPFTSPVGRFKPNQFGLHDMHGNVSEWCSDWYDSSYYANSPINDPQGSDEGACRLLRGGDWMVGPGDCQSAFRGAHRPSFRNSNVGFRVVQDVSEANTR